MISEKSTQSYWDTFFKNQIEGESDRATVIITSSILDQALESVLRNYLVQLNSTDDPLFDSAYAPLSNFSAKIDLAFRIGLLPPNFAKALHLIRKIRNDFAHNVSACTFNEPQVRNRVLELNKTIGVTNLLSGKLKNFQPGVRGDFEMNSSLLIWMIWADAERIQALKTPDEWKPSEELTNKIIDSVEKVQKQTNTV
ncbi:MAG: DUF4145 domain-containing protein [Melioribacteraceae bacterium]|nr:DUF4145 domain-containing protein [Melioribacteraceae bacterium]